MKFRQVEDLRRHATALRQTLEQAFSADTAYGGSLPGLPSAGHCAVVAAIAYSRFGGSLLSTNIAGQSHWFNRVRVGADLVDVDLTGDQFGGPAVRLAPAGRLYADSRVRVPQEVTPETRARTKLLVSRAGLAIQSRPLEHPSQREKRDLVGVDSVRPRRIRQS